MMDGVDPSWLFNDISLTRYDIRLRRMIYFRQSGRWCWTLAKSRRSRVYHQHGVLYLINSAGVVYHQAAERFFYTPMAWWYTKAACRLWWYTAWRRMIYQACGLDKKSTTFCRKLSIFGPPKGIRTPALQNRNLLRYPAAPWTDLLSILYYLLPFLQVIFEFL